MRIKRMREMLFRSVHCTALSSIYYVNCLTVWQNCSSHKRILNQDGESVENKFYLSFVGHQVMIFAMPYVKSVETSILLMTVMF